MTYKHWFALVLVIFFQPDAGFAQTTTIPVRAGEHADYTRLAITFPPDVIWQVTQNMRVVDIRITGATLRFDLSQTFTRIPRTRLLSAENSSDGLILTLACDCTVRAAEDLPQMLVLDILSTSELSPPKTSGSSRPKPRPERGTASIAAQKAGQNLAQAFKHQNASTWAATDLLSLPAAPVLADHSGPLKRLDGELTDQDTRNMTQDILVALGTELASAVGLGLLEPETGAKPTPPTERLDISHSPNIGQQLRITDAVMRARGDTPAKTQPRPDTCPDPDDLAIHLWGRKTGVSADWPDFAAIFDDTNRIDPNEVRKAAKHLLFLGFGTEAMALLSMTPDETPETAVLLALAAILDNAPNPSARLPDGLESCSDSGAIWAALFHLDDGLPKDFPIAEAIRGIGILPHHLRLHLGPQLLRYLVAKQETRHALTLDDILQRTVQHADNESPDYALIGSFTKNKAPLTTEDAQFNTASLPTPENVLHALRQHAARGTPPTKTIEENAEIYIFTLRGTDIAKKISAELIIGHARRFDFTLAFEKIKNPELNFSNKEKNALRSQLFQMLLEHDNNGNFIKQIFSADPWNQPVEPHIMFNLADRLDKLGFTEQAQNLRLMKLELISIDAWQDLNSASGLNMNITDSSSASAFKSFPSAYNHRNGNLTTSEIEYPVTIASSLTTNLQINTWPDGQEVQEINKDFTPDIDQEKSMIDDTSADTYVTTPVPPENNLSSAPQTDEGMVFMATPISQISDPLNLPQALADPVGPVSIGRKTIADSAALRQRLGDMLDR